MNIRKAEQKDASAIRILMEQLGYPTEEGFIAKKLIDLSKSSDHCDLVCELEGKVLGFLSLHFIPQIAFEADYAVISYFVVDDNSRSLGIGKALEERCTALAIERKCKRIMVHSNARRTDAHRFYLRQGFVEYPKDFVKFL
ncbi:GNAT family N-acetyltransferase [Pedobacter panaciterrae]|jgi:N-acetylglutamate synthase and related acetyltransferases|uniref:GNAT family N-acetyltransferase n=1 Tax=Pedobacter panaciterrae TaxID=363849 RepID=UPI00155D9095|nr:GNAT family N-acetyltransferase [Pedobacter panaciterrae]NQX52666.1 GNAT family N-acetyltransferase [Pedobacter panaciterrae]